MSTGGARTGNGWAVVSGRVYPAWHAQAIADVTRTLRRRQHGAHSQGWGSRGRRQHGAGWGRARRRRQHWHIAGGCSCCHCLQRRRWPWGRRQQRRTCTWPTGKHSTRRKRELASGARHTNVEHITQYHTRRQAGVSLVHAGASVHSALPPAWPGTGPAGSGGGTGGGGRPGLGPAGSGGGLGSGTLDRPACCCLPSSASCFFLRSSSCDSARHSTGWHRAEACACFCFSKSSCCYATMPRHLLTAHINALPLACRCCR